MGLAVEVAKVEGVRDKLDSFEQERMRMFGLSPSQYTLQEVLDMIIYWLKVDLMAEMLVLLLMKTVK